MRKMKTIALILCITMVCGLCPAFSAGADAVSKPGDTLILTVEDESYSETGNWNQSAVVTGYNGMPSRYTSDGSCKWVPKMPQGTYKVSAYKSVHANSLRDQMFEIWHRGKMDVAVMDCTTGTPDWQELGTFDFWGDGGDQIAVNFHEDGVTVVPNIRVSALKFELVALLNDPIPAEKPSPSPVPYEGNIGGQTDIPDGTIAPPEKAGDSMVIPADNTLYCKIMGNANFSTNVPSLDGKPSLYTDGSVTVTPYMPAGTYKVSFYKVVHANSLPDQLITVTHQKQADTAIMDCTAGDPGWVELGAYDFWGNGNDTVAVTAGESAGPPVRFSAVKFELIKLSDTPAPSGKPLPRPQGADIPMDIPAQPITGEGVQVVIDGLQQNYDQPAIIVEGRTLVPLRGIFETLDAEVSWQDETQTVTALKDNTVITLQIGNKTAVKNGADITLDVEPQLVNDRTMVPARFVSESLGAQVDWDEKTEVVSITTSGEKPKSILVTPKEFIELGTWNIRSQSSIGAFNDATLIGIQGEDGADPVPSEPAVANVHIYEEGEYSIFFRSKDYSTAQGTRYFEAELNGERIPFVFGQHGKNAFAWEKIGPVNLKKGNLEIKLIDSSTFYARCDAIFITKDLTLKSPPNTYDGVLALADVAGLPYEKNVFFPAWAKALNDPQETVRLASDSVKLSFHQVPTINGNVIQKEMEVNTGAGFEQTTSRENSMGTLLMYAKEGAVDTRLGQFPVYSSTFTSKGSLVESKDSDFYKIGQPYWLIPSEMKQIDERTVELYADCDVASSVMRISLEDGSTEPKVTYTFTAKTDGVFTAGIGSGTETQADKVDYVFAPFRFNGTKIPPQSYLVTEQYCTVPMALKTIQNDAGKQVSIGMAVDPESIPLRWPKLENSEYGFCLRGPDAGGVVTLAAPLFSSENAKMNSGESYTIQYHMIERPGTWTPVYEHLVSDLYHFSDYRQNYFGSMNDAIFNATKLAAGDKAGWDENQKGYYNIEYENMVTQSNPLVFMSTYLMSEDEDFLESRTIPTLAYLLTRPGFHYSNGDQQAPQLGEGAIGRPCANYGSSVFGGAYMMSQGLTEAFKNIGIDNGFVGVDTYGSSPSVADYVALYKYTGDEAYLTKAKTEGDQFIASKIDGPRNGFFDEAQFIAIDFYPQFFALLDLYEVCGEQKYLDAAVRGAKNLLPTVWVYPNDDNGADYTVSADYVRENRYGKEGLPAWYGKERYAVGLPDKLNDLEDQTVPFWLVSRAGLSLEQTFTYSDSGNMIMANWAPDLLRLAQYSGEEIFETYARNAVVGRHMTYPGYYYTNYYAYQMDPSYPYEGPTITGLYWHHIQPFLAMMQDFLITQAWDWSDQKISFPSYRNMGYAYFSNRMYGGEAGKFFDEDGMWLWLKEGLVEPDNIQLDWIGARKDGVAAFAFMNESKQEETATITLGDEVTGGVAFNGDAVVYDAEGNTSTVKVENSKLTITVPPRKLAAIKISAPAVKTPGFVEGEAIAQQNKNQGLQTAKPKEGETDTGYILQMSPDHYFAYIFITETIKQADDATLHYKIGSGAWQTLKDDYAPYEFIVKVEDPKASITYYVEKTVKGQTVKSSEKTLTPMTK